MMHIFNPTRAVGALVAVSLIAAAMPQIIARELGASYSVYQDLYRLMLYACGAVGVFAFVMLWRLQRERNLAPGFLNDWLVILTLLGAGISVLMGDYSFRPMYPFAVLCTIMVFVMMPKLHLEINLFPVALLMGLISATPVFLYLFFDADYSSFFVSESFRGWSGSRTDYAWITAFAMLLAILSKRTFLLILLPLMAVGLHLSGSRAGLLSYLMAAVVFTSVFVIRKKYLSLALVALTVLILHSGTFFHKAPYDGLPRQIRDIVYSDDTKCDLEVGVKCEVGLFADYSFRIDLLKASTREAYENILLGKGDYFQGVSLRNFSIEAHNSVLQSIINFGALVTIGWFLLLGRLFFQVPYEGKAILIFGGVFGLFQPGFDALLFSPGHLLILLASQKGAWCGPDQGTGNLSGRMGDDAPK